MAKIKWEKVPDQLLWNKIKSLRLERKLKQIQVAVGADITLATLWALEQGYEKKTTDRTKRKLAKFFKCDVNDIFPAEMIGDKTLEQHLKESQKD